MRLHCNQNGIGMIEMIAVLLSMAVLGAIATPSLIALRDAQITRALMLDVSSHLAMTRSAAITHGVDALMCPLGNDRQCADTHDWSQGWLIYLDPDGNRLPDRDSDIIFGYETRNADRTRLSTSKGRERIRYLSSGRTVASNATFYICSGSSLKGRIIINMGGRVRSSRPTSPTDCPA